MRKTLLFILMAFCAIASSFAQTPKDVLAFQFKTSIASSAMLCFEVNSPQEEFYVDWGDGFKKKYAAGNYAYPNPVYSTNHKEREFDISSMQLPCFYQLFLCSFLASLVTDCMQ